MNEDLEYFYISLQNPESRPKAEVSYSFLTQKLTEEESRLVDERNQDYLNTFHHYSQLWMEDQDSNKFIKKAAQNFREGIEQIKKSNYIGNTTG